MSTAGQENVGIAFVEVTAMAVGKQTVQKTQVSSRNLTYSSSDYAGNTGRSIRRITGKKIGRQSFDDTITGSGTQRLTLVVSKSTAASIAVAKSKAVIPVLSAYSSCSGASRSRTTHVPVKNICRVSHCVGLTADCCTRWRIRHSRHTI